MGEAFKEQMEFNNTAPRTTLGEAYTPDIHCLVLDGDRLCTGGKDMNVKIRSLATGEEERTLQGHSYDVNAIAVAGGTLFSGADAKGEDRQFLKAWDMESGTSHSFASPHDGGVWSPFLRFRRPHHPCQRHQHARVCARAGGSRGQSALSPVLRVGPKVVFGWPRRQGARMGRGSRGDQLEVRGLGKQLLRDGNSSGRGRRVRCVIGQNRVYLGQGDWGEAVYAQP